MAQSKVKGIKDGKGKGQFSIGNWKVMLHQDDAKNFLKWGTLGFVGLGVYQLCMTMAKRNINPCVEFMDPVESMNSDPIIRDAMITLQSYRELNPWLFKTALQNIDQLLFLENALLSQQIQAVKNDKVASWSFFRMAIHRLGAFQYLVRERMGTEHGMTVNIFVRKIYAQLQKHILNILHMCTEFKPEHLIANAPLEINRILKNYEEGKEPVNSYQKWDELRKNVDESELAEAPKKKHNKHQKEHPKYDSNKSRHSRTRDRTRTNLPEEKTEEKQ